MDSEQKERGGVMAGRPCLHFHFLLANNQPHAFWKACPLIWFSPEQHRSDKVPLRSSLIWDQSVPGGLSIMMVHFSAKI